MTRARQELGRAGEAVAAEHLRTLGYRILARRWRVAGREVDLVAERDGTVVFVEVKTRREGSLAPPAAAVDRRKRERIATAARIGARRWPARVYRFDVVSVTWSRRGAAVDHLEDAFRLGG